MRTTLLALFTCSFLLLHLAACSDKSSSGTSGTSDSGNTVPADIEDADPENKQQAIRVLLEHTGDADAALEMLESEIEGMKQQAGTEVPGEFWLRYMEEANDSRGRLIDSLASVYDRHFTEEEVRAILEFYQSPVGKKMAEKVPAIAEDRMEVSRNWALGVLERARASFEKGEKK